jgi:hypothetical protein
MSYISIQVNDGIAFTLQNFVEAKPYTINVANIAIPSFTYVNNFPMVR